MTQQWGCSLPDMCRRPRPVTCCLSDYFCREDPKQGAFLGQGWSCFLLKALCHLLPLRLFPQGGSQARSIPGTRVEPFSPEGFLTCCSAALHMPASPSLFGGRKSVLVGQTQCFTAGSVLRVPPHPLSPWASQPPVQVHRVEAACPVPGCGSETLCASGRVLGGARVVGLGIGGTGWRQPGSALSAGPASLRSCAVHTSSRQLRPESRWESEVWNQACREMPQETR